MKRAAIYARFSTDMQNERSIDDQIALCREYATRQGLTVVGTFEDRALSGASIHNRPGIESLLLAARNRQFETVLSESMSRIGRDQEDRAAIRKRLRLRGSRL
jgi:DNA invertase Pin-like site-specific DNA recombinase